MQIASPCVVGLTWQVCDAQNRPIDELARPTEFFFGGDDLLAAVEQALAGHAQGEEVRVQLEPEQAFGEYDAGLVCYEDRRLFPEAIEPGMAFEGLPAGARTPGMPADAIYVVTEVYPEHVVLDGNHPLAGIALRLTIQVRSVREATDDELEAASVGNLGVTLLETAAGRAPVPD